MTQASAFRTITDQFSVSPQITPDDVARAKAEGFTVIVNNRPDGEAPNAPQSDVIAAAAAAAGMTYVAIPITRAGFSGPQVETLQNVLKDLGENDRVLGYCGTGTRSTFLWALARAKMGGNPMNIANNAAQAGYDITPVRAMVDALATATD